MRSTRHGRFTHFSASADTLTLSKDQILDFGDAVDVLDGSRTYFGKQIKDWAEHKNFGKTAETVSHDLKEKRMKNGGSRGSFGGGENRGPFGGKVWKDTKVYQLRANTPSAFYETFVISIPVENKELQQRKSGFKSLMNFKDAEREKRQTKKPRNLQKKNGKNGRREDGKNRESGKGYFPENVERSKNKK